MNIPILIPAYNPDHSLIALVRELMDLNVENIIIVNDGSKPECKRIFQELSNSKKCHILHHAVNLGKGRALKTGLNYCYLNFKDSPGVVTADADGQHLPAYILSIATVLEKNSDKLILGARKFRKNVPFRSLIGNILTKYIFFFLVGKKLSDTQTGLRGIPRSCIPNFLTIEGEGYDYEINMLISTKANNLEIAEEEIGTLYLEGNVSSHFNPLIDSMKIYFVLLRFLFSSTITSLVDFVVFILTLKFSAHLWSSIFLARLTASTINFILNRDMVFRNKGNMRSLLIKYYLLLVTMGLISYASIKTMVSFVGLNVILSKLIVETTLFFANFLIQRDLVFVNTDQKMKFYTSHE